MSDEASLKWIERMQAIARKLPHEYVILKPFETIDAALWEFLSIQQHEDTPESPSFKRYRITNGSARYSLSMTRSNNQSVALANIYARSASEQKTYINIALRDVAATTSLGLREALEGFCRLELYTFYLWLQDEDERIDTLAAVAPVFPPRDEEGIPTTSLFEMPAVIKSTIQNRVGRPPADLNEWARQEVQAGRTQAVVFREFLEKLDIEPSDEEGVRKARDRFRQALARAKRTKPKRTK